MNDRDGVAEGGRPGRGARGPTAPRFVEAEHERFDTGRAGAARGKRRPRAAIVCEASDALPKLGWIATLDLSTGRLRVLHGHAVECRPDFLVEGVWDGPFDDGDFHRGAHLFGSGIRRERDAVYFVPSCALVDRLVYCRDGKYLKVSNSLLALLAATGAELDRRHDYVVEAKALSDGVDAYDTSFHVLHPTIERFHQVFHKAIVVRGEHVALERTIAVRRFESFEDYYGMLRGCVARLVRNATDPRRQTPLAMYGTLSSGYDSTAVTTIVRDFGVREFFTYVGSSRPSSRGGAAFRTARIAEVLNVHTVELEPPREPAIEDDLLLRAGSPLGAQGPLLSLAAYIERSAGSAALFTGYQGGVVWGLNVPEKFISEGIVRRDISGLDLCELRLKSGFCNVAIPFLYAASIASIAAISRSDEMAPWRVNTDYDRPISRRIIETAGVPRGAFARVKAGILGNTVRPANPALRVRYFDYVRRELMPLPLFYARVACDRYALRAVAQAKKLSRQKLGAPRLAELFERHQRTFSEGYSWFGGLNVYSALYTWAVNESVRALSERGLGPRTVREAGGRRALTANA
jgi:hypothetical protein